MKTSFLLLLLFVWVAHGDEPSSPREEGRKLFTNQPRTLEHVRKAANQLAAIAKANPQNYEDQWQAARAWGWLAEFEPKRDQREHPANEAIAFARRACQLEDKKIEGHYYLANGLGSLADCNHTAYALDYVDEMQKELRRCLEIDERFDEAGPRRALGLVLLDLPASHNEKIKRASPHLQRAVELAPDYPENQLALAQLLYKNNEDAAAFAALDKVLKAKPWPDKEDEDAEWKAEARKLERKIGR